MKKLFYATIGATLTLMSASPAFAQDVPTEMLKVVESRSALERNMAGLAVLTAGTELPTLDEAVLGESVIPVLGFDAPLNVQLDMLTALRADAAKNRALKLVPSGLSLD